jgi:mannose-6-phosphate isomerase-like protein (cupin superfamily)
MNDNLEKLKRITKELPVLSNIIKERYKSSVAYAMVNGICTGEELFYCQSVAVQRSFLSKGAKFPIHLHNQVEWLIVSSGYIINDTEGEITHIKDSEGIKIERGKSHCVEAVEDTWLIGITIPASEGYPHG